MNEQICHQMQERLLVLLDGELSQVDRVEVQSHIDACPSCETQRRKLQELRSSYHENAGTGPSEGFAGRVAELALRLPASRPSPVKRAWHQLTRPRKSFLPRCAVASLALASLSAVAACSSLGLVFDVLQKNSTPLPKLVFNEWCFGLAISHQTSAALALAIALLGLLGLRFPEWLADVYRSRPMSAPSIWKFCSGMVLLGGLTAIPLWTTEGIEGRVNTDLHQSTMLGARPWLSTGLGAWFALALGLTALAFFRCNRRNLPSLVTSCSLLVGTGVALETLTTWSSTTLFGLTRPAEAYSSAPHPPISLANALCPFTVDPSELTLALVGAALLIGGAAGIWLSSDGLLAHGPARRGVGKQLEILLGSILAVLATGWSLGWAATVSGPQLAVQQGQGLTQRVLVLGKDRTASVKANIPGWVLATAASPATKAALQGPYNMAAKRAFLLERFVAASTWDDQRLLELDIDEALATSRDPNRIWDLFQNGLLFVTAQTRLSAEPMSQIFPAYRKLAERLHIDPVDWMRIAEVPALSWGHEQPAHRANVRGRLLIDGRPAAGLAVQCLYSQENGQGWNDAEGPTKNSPFHDMVSNQSNNLSASPWTIAGLDPKSMLKMNDEGNLFQHTTRTDDQGRFEFLHLGDSGSGCALAVLLTGPNARFYLKRPPNRQPVHGVMPKMEPYSIHPDIVCQNSPGLFHPGLRDLDLGDIRLEVKP